MNCDLGGEGKGEKSGTTGHKTGGYQSVNREVLRVGGKGWGRKVACCGRESKDLGVRQMCVPTLGYCMIKVKFLSFPEPQTPHLSNGDNKPPSRCCWN